MSPALWLVGAGMGVRGGAVGASVDGIVGDGAGVSGSSVNVGIGVGVGVALGTGFSLGRVTGCGARQPESAPAATKATQARRNEPMEQG